MNKKWLIFIISFIFTVNYTQARDDQFYYKFNYNNNLFNYSERYKKRKSVSEQEKLVQVLISKIESEFNIKIEFQKSEHTDIKGNSFFSYNVNIKTDDNIHQYFQGPNHRSIMIETICVNLLQPDSSGWHIRFLILKVNGIFPEYLETDSFYSAFPTKREYGLLRNFYDIETFPEDLKR